MQCSLCQEIQKLKTTTVALRESQGAKATADVSVDNVQDNLLVTTDSDFEYNKT